MTNVIIFRSVLGENVQIPLEIKTFADYEEWKENQINKNPYYPFIDRENFQHARERKKKYHEGAERKVKEYQQRKEQRDREREQYDQRMERDRLEYEPILKEQRKEEEWEWVKRVFMISAASVVVIFIIVVLVLYAIESRTYKHDEDFLTFLSKHWAAFLVAGIIIALSTAMWFLANPILSFILLLLGLGGATFLLALQVFSGDDKQKVDKKKKKKEKFDKQNPILFGKHNI